AVDRNHTLRRGDSGKGLDQAPGRIGNNRAPLRMQVGARAVGTQLQKSYALETQADHGPLFGVFVTFVPDAAVGREHLGVFRRKAIKTGTAKAVFAVKQESQRHRKL